MARADWRDLIHRRRRASQIYQLAVGGNCEAWSKKIWVSDSDFRLRHSIQQVGFLHQVVTEAVVENAETGSQHGFWRGFPLLPIPHATPKRGAKSA